MSSCVYNCVCVQCCELRYVCAQWEISINMLSLLIVTNRQHIKSLAVQSFLSEKYVANSSGLAELIV